MVTNTSYTRTAKIAATEHLELLVLAELENELFSLRQFYREAIADYESEAISREYIALDAIYESSNSRIANVGSWLMDYVTQHTELPPSVVVLADYGAGKTTLLRKLFHDFAVAYVAGKTTLKPLYLELKHLADQDDVEAFISVALRRKIGIDIPSSLFWKELRRGGFLVLLDGFDEMSPQVDQTIRMSNFLRISPLFRWGSPAVLTCRPSYFIDRQEYEHMLDKMREGNSQLDIQLKKSRFKRADTAAKRVDLLYSALREKYVDEYLGPEAYTAQRYESAPLKTVFLRPFSESQIQEYLSQFDAKFRARCKRSSVEVRNFLLNVYDLSDLMRKPILLSMIKDTILLKGENFFNLASDYGPAALYELYTSLNFDIDWAKGYTRRFLTREERRTFAHALAIAMYDNSKLEVSYDDLLTIVNKNSGIMGALRARFETVTKEQIAADVVVCTFITRTPTEEFRFVHKSYMEFFLASFLNRNFSTRRPSARLLPKEIVYFLGSFARLGEPIADRIKDLLERFKREKQPSLKKGKIFFRSNIYRIYLYSTDDFEDRSFRGAMLDEIDLMNVRFNRVSFLETSFYRNRWENSQFQKVNFLECRIDNCTLVDIVLERVNLNAKIRNCQAQRLQIGRSRLDTSCESFNLEGTTIQDTSIDLRGTMYCRQSCWIDTTLSLACSEEDHTHVEFSACQIMQTVILATPHEGVVPRVVLRDCKFRKTGIVGVFLDFGAFENMQNAAQELHGFAFIKTSSMQELSSRRLDNGLKCEEGLCWLSESFVVINWNSWKEGEILIPEQVIHIISQSGMSEAAVSKCILQWQPWIQ